MLNIIEFTFVEELLEDLAPNFGELFTIAPVDIILYGLTFLLTVLLGLKHSSTSKSTMLQISIKISYIFVTLSIVFVFYNMIDLVFVKETEEEFLELEDVWSLLIQMLFFKLIILVLNLFLLTYLPNVLHSKYYTNTLEFIILIQISIALAMTIVTAINLVVILLALEGFSLILYILTTIDRTYGGITAAAKYFSYGTLGSVLLFWGVVHIYTIVPVTEWLHLEEIFSLINSEINSQVEISLDFATGLIILGLLIKFGAAPFHQWVADVYSGSHLTVTLFFSTIVKFIIFIIISRIALITSSSDLIDLTAALSLIVGTIMTLRQLEIKRFLAYSSITHVGFILMGDFSSAIVYILLYICSSFLFFSVLLTINSGNKELVYFSDISKVKNSGYWSPLLLTISLLSMAGLPPFAGFFGKFMVWNSLLEDLYIYNDFTTCVLLITSIVLSLITIFYYARLLIYIFVNNDETSEEDIHIKKLNTISVSSQQTILTIINVFWVFFHTTVLTFIIQI